MLVLLILNGHLIENSAVEFEANSPNAGYYLVIFVVNVCHQLLVGLKASVDRCD